MTASDDQAGGFLAAVAAAIGADRVVTDPDVVASHTTDWTGRWRGEAAAVVRPRHRDEVAAVVRAARGSGVALVTQGGNTGLVGGGVPDRDAGRPQVVVDIRRLDHLEPVDLAAAQVSAGAGVTLARLQDHVRPAGLAFAVDLAARGAATIGGMVATNAGGLHVLRHGPMRSQVVGLTAVLGTGDVVAVNPGGLLKDNTGYDLAGLLCGSEGTLGIVTDARLRLVPAPTARLVALLGLPSAAAAVAALPVLRAVPAVVAVEAMAGPGLATVAAHLGCPPPFDPAPGWVVLVELVATADPAADLLADLGAVLERLGPAVTATAVADDEAGAERLWRWREAHSEAAAGLGLVHKADVTVPHVALAELLDALPGSVEELWPGAVTLLYGHLGDGNVHVNVVGPPADDHRVLDAVLESVLAVGGSISAEHGVGVAKRAWLERQKGTAVVSAYRAVKAALDPDAVLNPHVLLPVGAAGPR